MDLDLLLRQPLAIQIHLATVIPAFFLGTWLIFFSKRGSRMHRALGVIYLSLMTVTATAAIFVKTLNPGHFSWLHIFVMVTYYSVFAALFGIRRHDLRMHRNAMMGLYFGGLVFAGALTFIPHRLMHELFFPSTPSQAAMNRAIK